MEFTQTEKELIIKNTALIQNYLETEIVPNITQRIIIGFGGIHHNPRGFESIDKFRLFIAPETQPLTIYLDYGRETKQGTIAMTNCFSHTEPIQEMPYEGRYELIQKWAEIKRQILAQVEQQQVAKTTLENFAI